MQLNVQTNKHSYPIYICDDEISSFSEIFVERFHPKTVVLGCNATVMNLYGSTLLQSLCSLGLSVYSLIIPDNEEAKSLESYQLLIEKLETFPIHRDTYFLALGGGITGDVIGFLAATYLRGVPFVQIPTTLLAMIDSSVGGKVGLNSHGGKNRVGAFYPPVFVYSTTSVLKTLAREEWLCGFGEILKHGLLGDRCILDICSRYGDAFEHIPSEALQELIYRNCAFKSSVVERDEFEQNSRALLNFGHTVGHAIETLLSHRVPHGICVAWGLRCELWWSVQKGCLSVDVYENISKIFESFSFPNMPSSLDMDAFVSVIQKDKKNNSNGSILCTLLHNIEEPKLYPLSVQEIFTLFQFPQEISA